MKNLKVLRAIVTAIVFTFSLNLLFAQSVEDATNAYNRGVELASSNLPKAVEALQQTVAIAEKAGDEGAEILKLAKQQIPVLQYNHATALYKDKKLDEAISNFKLAFEYATEYGDNGIAAKASDLLPKLLRVKGNNEYKENKFDDALASFIEALKFAPEFAGALLSKGQVLSKMNRNEEMKAAMDAAIEAGEKTNDEKTVEQARKFMTGNMINEANAAFKKNDFEKTINLLDQAFTYSEDNVEAYYLSAVAHNKLSKWDEALEKAQKGLELEEKTAAKQARFYYESGVAQAGKGASDEACASFKKAAVGPLAESANYQVKTVLKCN